MESGYLIGLWCIAATLGGGAVYMVVGWMAGEYGIRRNVRRIEKLAEAGVSVHKEIGELPYDAVMNSPVLEDAWENAVEEEAANE